MTGHQSVNWLGCIVNQCHLRFYTFGVRYGPTGQCNSAKISSCLMLLFLQNGVYIMHLLDTYSAGLSVITVSFLESIAIAWVYGLPHFNSDIMMMLGFRPNVYWQATWLVITPSLLIVSLICAFSVAFC